MRTLFLLIGLLLPLLSWSQINESDTVSFQLNSRIGGVLQTGNVEFYRLVASLEASARLGQEALVIKTQNDYLFQKFVKNKADESIHSMNFIYYQPDRRLYPYFVGLYSMNFRRDIDYRLFGGLGASYQIIVQPLHNLKISTNLLYESTGYAVADFNEAGFNGSPRISTWMNSLYMSGYHQIIQRKIGVFHEGYFQYSLTERDLWRLHFVLGLNFNLVKGLAVSTRLNYTYENIIAQGNQQEDLLWTWGVSYFFK